MTETTGFLGGKLCSSRKFFLNVVHRGQSQMMIWEKKKRKKKGIIGPEMEFSIGLPLFASIFLTPLSFREVIPA